MTRQRSVSKRQRFRVLRRDEFRCQYCGTTAARSELHVDHILPFSKGGPCDDWNLVTACMDCNSGKAGAPINRLCITDWILCPRDIITEENGMFWVTYLAETVPPAMCRPKMLDEWAGVLNEEAINDATERAGGKPAHPPTPFEVTLPRESIGIPYAVDIGEVLADHLTAAPGVGSDDPIRSLFEVGPVSVLCWATDEMVARSISPTEAHRNMAEGD